VGDAVDFQRASREQPPAAGLVLTFCRFLSDGSFIPALLRLPSLHWPSAGLGIKALALVEKSNGDLGGDFSMALSLQRR
jgi:hypothetical protein